MKFWTFACLDGCSTHNLNFRPTTEKLICIKCGEPMYEVIEQDEDFNGQDVPETTEV